MGAGCVFALKPNVVHVINSLVSCILKSPLLITDLISQHSSNHYPTCGRRVCFSDGTKCCLCNCLVSYILKSLVLIMDHISQHSSNHYPTCGNRVCFSDGTKCCLCNCLVSCLVKYLLLITDHISQHSSSFACLWEQGFIVMKPNVVYLLAVPYLTYKPKSGSMKKKHPCLSHMV